VITVALDQCADDPRPFVAAAAPTHPSLIDSEHLVADLYRLINVPTVVWIDENGRIVRPNDVAFGNDAFKDMHGIESAPHLNALRRWVTEGVLPMDEHDIRALQVLPTPEEQLGRTEFSLAWYLHRSGRVAAAERHFVRAGQLAPHDFTIRRGSMPIRGMDPMGPDFADLYTEWVAAGRPYYRAIPSPKGG
jgi:hypothetical protein